MTDTINRDKCPRCGAKGKYDSENRVHYYDCSTWWWDDDDAPDETVGMSCITRQRDTLQSKLAQAVEALDESKGFVDDVAGFPCSCNDAAKPCLSCQARAFHDRIRSTLSTLKDNPQPINKDNP